MTPILQPPPSTTVTSPPASNSPIIWLPYLTTQTGSEVFTLRLADALRDRGYIPHLQPLSPRWEFVPELMGLIKTPADVDAIIVNSWQATALLRRGPPTISIFHHSLSGADPEQFRNAAQRWYHHYRIRALEQRAFDRSRLVVAPSRFTRDTILASFGQRDVEVIHNGIDTGTFSPGGPRSSKPLATTAKLVFLAKPSIRKGFDLVLETMRQLGPRYRLDIIGGSPGGPLSDNVRALGRRPLDEVIHHLRHADALLFPSRLEGFGYAVAEAMACGLPPIALRRGAIPELVTHGQDGWLCDEPSPSCLANAVRTVCGDQTLRMKLSLQARRTAVERFSNAAFGARYDQMLRRIL
jgi:glycosyltransferase involved in cell wall biosynthesis